MLHLGERPRVRPAHHAAHLGLGSRQVQTRLGPQHPHDQDTLRLRITDAELRRSMLGEQLLPPFHRQRPGAHGESEAAGGARRLDVPSQTSGHEGLDAMALQLRAALLTRRRPGDRLEHGRLSGARLVAQICHDRRRSAAP